MFTSKHKSAYLSVLHSKLKTITKHLEKFDIAISLLKAENARKAANAAAAMHPPERHQQYVKQSVGKPKRWKREKS